MYKIIVVILIINTYSHADWVSWVKQSGGSSTEVGKSISTDENGNTFVTGHFFNTAIFGTTQLNSYGGADMFIAKYDYNGNCLWAKNAGGTLEDNGNCISIDAEGNSYVTGFFRGSAAFGTINLTSNGYSDIFLAKYDADGNCVWAMGVGGNNWDTGYGISTHENGNSIITGYFFGTITFGTIQLVSVGSWNFFLAKYDANGNCIWAKTVGGNSDTESHGYGIAIDSKGNSYVTGGFWGIASFDSINLTSFGSLDFFIAKYDPSGNCIWAYNSGGNDYDQGEGISISTDGNSYVTGSFNGVALFGSKQLISIGGEDIFIAKYDSIGNCIWAKNAGGNSLDIGSGISADTNGNLFVTGFFEEIATFDTIQLTSFGDRDVFIAKYDTDGNIIWASNGGGNDFDLGYSISVNAFGHTYLTGFFNGTATFGTTVLNTYGYSDVFILALNPNLSDVETQSLNSHPTHILLKQNYPNPFNPTTTIAYEIPQQGFVTLKVYDILGREVATLVNEEKPAGSYEVQYTANELTSGIYFYQLKAGEYSETKKMILLR